MYGYFSPGRTERVRQSTKRRDDVADRNCLAFTWRLAGDYDKAIAYHEHALKINMTRLGAAHASTIRTQEHLNKAKQAKANKK